MNVERKAKRAHIQKVILETIEAAGFITLAVLAPKVLGGMIKLGLFTHKRQTESIKRSVSGLVGKGLLEYKNNQLKITSGGRRYLLKCLSSGNNKELNKNIKWDKKWRVLIFDIPESRRFDRDSIRYALISIGFMKLQDSVWIYPFPCESIISLLKAETETEGKLIYMIVEALENDEEIKKYFGL